MAERVSDHLGPRASGAARCRLRKARRGRVPGVIILAVLVLVVFTVPATAQDSPRELRSAAWAAMAQGAFEDAIPPLQQLVRYYSDSDEARIVAQMQSVYFNLGLCLFLTGRFAESRPVFEAYLKRYPHTVQAKEAAVFLADGYRFSEQLAKAMEAYRSVLQTYRLNADWRTDVLVSMVRCALADEDWETALPLLDEARRIAPDRQRRTWAATLLVTAYLKEFELERVYNLVPHLLHPYSFSSRSVAYNMSALETAETLFAEEAYRDALWVYRLVYPYDRIRQRSEEHLQQLQRNADALRERQGKYRELLRAQESIAEIEGELDALGEVEDYNHELTHRIARAYMEVRRYREAGELYFYRYERSDGAEADEALYLSFHCYTQVSPWDRAFELGRLYMDNYGGGEYYDAVSLAVAQMHAQLAQWPEVIGVLTEALETSPDHESVVECMFLLGYASFMEEKFADASHWLRRMNREYPGNERMEEGTYWTGMALLFDTKYEDAREVFEFFLADYPRSPYLEDARFRRAVCDYGLSEFEQAGRRFDAFIANHPDSALVGEALMMRADVAGVQGQLQEAVEYYRRAMDRPMNVELYNYCAFRRGEMLFDLNAYPDLIRHFEQYLQQPREGLNEPQAIYWIVKGLWQQDERRGALEYLLDGVREYGRERAALGIDLLLNEWIGLSKQLAPDQSEAAWETLLQQKQTAEEAQEHALALRLERLFLYRPGESEVRREARIERLLNPRSVAHAPPGILELMMDLGMERGQTDLAVMAAREVIDTFTETDYALAARMLVAEHAMKHNDVETAIEHFNVVRTVFAASMEAAQALLHLGHIYMDRGDFDKADACFSEVLSVRQWRGPLWPAALFGRGECARRQRRFAEATAFYERIYVLYLHYDDWAAKAYLRRSECLMRMNQYVKAEETLEEMLANQALAETPEGEEAMLLLNRIRRRI